MNIKIGVVAVEASGDLLAIEILSELKKNLKDFEVIGVGGESLKEFGEFKSREDIEVMGIIEPLLNFFKINKFRKKIINWFLKENIDIFIGIDGPDFNFKIHEVLSKFNIRTIHMVCPSVWAWRPGRVKNFKFLDHMLCLFPFELNFCSTTKSKSFCVGHPLFNYEHKEEKRDTKLITLMPGSRKSEIKNNLSAMLDGFKKFDQDNNYRAIIPVNNKTSKDSIEEILEGKERVKVVIGESKDILKSSFMAVVCSGTATLEAFVTETPCITIYKTEILNHLILSRLVKAEFISLPNIICNEQIYKELIQDKFNSETLCDELKRIISSRETITSRIRFHKKNLPGSNFSEVASYLHENYRD